MSKSLAWYRARLQARPVLTQLVTTGGLFGTGDVLAQQGVERVALRHDLIRTGRMVFFGAFMAGP